jgi:hypothetical protein
MKTIDFLQIITKRNPLMVYDDSLSEKSSNYSCREKIDKTNEMLKTNNFFDFIKKKVSNKKS